MAYQSQTGSTENKIPFKVFGLKQDKTVDESILVLGGASIGLVYIKNNCFAINPLLSFLGYKAFQCEYSYTIFNSEKKFKAIFLAKGSDIQNGQKYSVGLLEKSIYRISIFTKQN